MKISLNDQQILVLTELQKRVIQNDISSEIFEDDMKRRLRYIIEHPCERYIDQNASVLRETLQKKKIASVPADKMQFAEVALSDEEILDLNEKKDISLKVDNKELFKISSTHKKILKIQNKNCHIDSHIQEQLQWILTHKFERCMERLRKEWEPKLKERGITSFPVGDQEFASLVFSQSDYKNKSQRETELKRVK